MIGGPVLGSSDAALDFFCNGALTAADVPLKCMALSKAPFSGSGNQGNKRSRLDSGSNVRKKVALSFFGNLEVYPRHQFETVLSRQVGFHELACRRHSSIQLVNESGRGGRKFAVV
jgi:hypothetical protein